MKLGPEEIRLMRAARRWTQGDLSRITGISQSQISRIENGLQARPHEEKVLLEAFTGEKAKESQAA